LDRTDPILLPGLPEGSDTPERRRQRLLEEIAAAIGSTRIQRGVSLDEAAAASGIEAADLEAAEAGERALSQEQLTALADTYGVDVTAFFGGKETPLSFLAGF
jgi:transcriptional regulator with XRE-family HTH domain